MDKSKILCIGIGRAGNIILNSLLKKDKRIAGLFINTSASDLKGLEMLDINRNAFLFPSVNGSGRDRKVAREILKSNAQSLADISTRFPMQNEVFIIFSMDGGTGSGITPSFAKMLKKVAPNKHINLIGILPDYNKVGKVSLDNTIDCWNEINRLASEDLLIKNGTQTIGVKAVDTIMLVNNSKRKTYGEINTELVDSLYNSFNMNGECADGSIDDNDIKRTYNNQGYGAILTIHNDMATIEDTIKVATMQSIYALPQDLKCSFLAVSTDDKYNPTNIATAFEYKSSLYVGINKKHNTILMTGCDEPTNVIEYIQMVRDDMENKEEVEIKRTYIPTKTNTTNIDEPKNELTFELTTQELDNLFEDIF